MDMNTEPVAWRTHYPSGWEYKDGNPPFELKGNSQLLYTHPATQDSEPQSCQEADGCPTEMAVLKRFWRSHQTAKTLTDEEIAGAIARGWCREKNSMKVMDSDLAWAIAEEIRAILRKAQEK